ncbi:hypothetical protein EI94DRAFT_1777463 [Lactarius quietus]|nr:hypothetical protein EI94DRAFT_1777463 [Lactarius quietus]
MKPRDYCCCAIPVVNAGVYATLIEQFVLGILAGTLSIATPQIVGASTPSSARWIFAVICYIGAIIQVFGFIGVAQEKPIMFRRYTTLHILITTAAFSVAAAWIIVSATRHNTAKSNYNVQIFPWVDVGIMGGLWILLAVSQFYFYLIISGYGVGQRGDHEKYNSIYSMTGLNSDDVPLAKDSRWIESASSDNAMLDSSFKDRPTEPVPQPTYFPSEQTSRPNRSHYSDPYYSGAEQSS